MCAWGIAGDIQLNRSLGDLLAQGLAIDLESGPGPRLILGCLCVATCGLCNVAVCTIASASNTGRDERPLDDRADVMRE